MDITEIINYLSLDDSSFTQRKEMIRLTEHEIDLLSSIHEPIKLYEDELIDAFYDHLMLFEHAQEMLNDQTLRERLKQSQRKYFRRLTAGIYDFDYAVDRIRVGIAHHRVGLTPQWYIGAYGIYLENVCKSVAYILEKTPEKIEPTLTALHKIVLLDITLAFDAYMFASHLSIEEARKSVSDKYSEQLKISDSIAKIQEAFIVNESFNSALGVLLHELITLTNSTFGLAGDVLYTEKDTPYLKVRITTDTVNPLDSFDYFQFNHQLNSAINSGNNVMTEIPLIENTHSFLSLPFTMGGKVVGIIGLANSPAGYSEQTVELLQPILDTLDSLSEARKIKNELRKTISENNHLALVAKQTINGVIITDAEFKLKWCNTSFEKISGYVLVELLGKKSYDLLIGPETNLNTLDRLKKSIENKKAIEIEILKYHKSGRSFWSKISCNPTFNKKGIHTGFVSVELDITETKKNQFEIEKLRLENEQRVANLLHKSADAMGIINHDMVITDCNEAAAALFGLASIHELIGLSPLSFSPIDQKSKNSSELAEFYFNKAMNEGYQRFEWIHFHSIHKETPIEVTLTSVIYLGERCIQVIWRDLTELKAKEKKIKQLAFFDELTGLANINLFSDRVRFLIKKASENKQIVAVIYIELINLADINETMGYTAGDTVISAVAKRLESLVYRADMLTRFVFDDKECFEVLKPETIDQHFDSLARINSNVFALAATLSSAEKAPIMVSRLHQLFNQPLNIYKSEVLISTRAGIALYPQDSDTVEAITRGAAIALKTARESSLNSYYFNTQLGEKTQQRSLIAEKLVHTLIFSPKDLSIRLQPQINLCTGQLAGIEILIRWHDKRLGYVPPDFFIPIAEERGLINKLTKRLIEMTNELLLKWRKEGIRLFEDRGVRLALNISARTLDDEQAVKALVDQIKNANLSPNDYELEVTETGLMRDPEKAIAVLNKLALDGFIIAIDDFGTGHSSLNYLKAINADTLKIDISFVRTMLEDEKNLGIVKTVISAANIFGMKSLAEGVEDENIAQKLKLLGCDYAQGYHFSKPLTIAEFEQNWLYNK